MFTFSFGTAMAASITVDQCSTAMSNEMTNQLGYLNAAKKQAVDTYVKDADKYGFITIDSKHYNQAAIEAAADSFIGKIQTVMSVYIGSHLAEASHANTDINNLASQAIASGDNSSKTAADGDTAVEMQDRIEAETTALNKSQAPLTKAYVEGKLAEAKASLEKYDNKKDYTTIGAETLTAAEYVQKLIKDAEDDIALIAKENDVKKVVAFYNLYFGGNTGVTGVTTATTGFKALLAAVPTAEDTAATEGEVAKTVEAAVHEYLQYGINTIYNTYKVALVGEDYKVNAAIAADDTFYEADETGSGATVFGVHVVNKNSLTKAEMTAVNNAFYAAIVASADVVKEAAETPEEVALLYGVHSSRVVGPFATAILFNQFKADNNTLLYSDAACTVEVPAHPNASDTFYMPIIATDAATFLNTLANSMEIADKYAEVEKAGEALKAKYVYGQKIYDNDLVDAAVKAAKDFVYADLGGTLETDPIAYIAEAADDINDRAAGYNYATATYLADLKLTVYEIENFNKAIADAKDKFDDTVKYYGENKTAEADKVYCKDQYADNTNLGSAGRTTTSLALGQTKYASIKTKTFALLDEAQSYEEIEKIMTEAAEKLGKLLKEADEKNVEDAKDAYLTSLGAYKNLQASLIGDKISADTLNDALDAGKALIDEATTVDGVKAAYADAQALFEGLKTDSELDAAAKAVIKAINDLTSVEKLTAADADAVKDVYAQYVEYVNTPGADNTDITNYSVLRLKVQKVVAEQKAAIEDAAKALKKKVDAVNTGSDADSAAFLALKAEVEKLVEDGDALNDFVVDEVNDDDVQAVTGFVDITWTDFASTSDFGKLEALLGTGNAFWNAEVEAAGVALVKAGKEGGTAADMQAALDAYNKLTDRQKYALDESVLPWITVVKQKLADSVEALKVKTSTKAYKGYIKVSWKVTGDAEAADGYQIYRSTKATSAGKKIYTTKKATSRSYKNSSVKKGTKYYYKVRAFKVVDGVTYYSDWSTRGIRTAK